MTNNSILNDPLEEIQLCDSCGYTIELNALGAAEWVEEFFRVPVETRLVSDVNSEHLPIRANVSDVLVFGVVGHKPLNSSKGHTVVMTKDILKVCSIFRDGEKLCQT